MLFGKSGSPFSHVRLIGGIGIRAASACQRCSRRFQCTTGCFKFVGGIGFPATFAFQQFFFPPLPDGEVLVLLITLSRSLPALPSTTKHFNTHTHTHILSLFTLPLLPQWGLRGRVDRTPLWRILSLFTVLWLPQWGLRGRIDRTPQNRIMSQHFEKVENPSAFIISLRGRNTEDIGFKERRYRQHWGDSKDRSNRQQSWDKSEDHRDRHRS